MDWRQASLNNPSAPTTNFNHLLQQHQALQLSPYHLNVSLPVFSNGSGVAASGGGGVDHQDNNTIPRLPSPSSLLWNDPLTVLNLPHQPLPPHLVDTITFQPLSPLDAITAPTHSSNHHLLSNSMNLNGHQHLMTSFSPLPMPMSPLLIPHVALESPPHTPTNASLLSTTKGDAHNASSSISVFEPISTTSSIHVSLSPSSSSSTAALVSLPVPAIVVVSPKASSIVPVPVIHTPSDAAVASSPATTSITNATTTLTAGTAVVNTSTTISPSSHVTPPPPRPTSCSICHSHKVKCDGNVVIVVYHS
jgi:hypothetical protein